MAIGNIIRTVSIKKGSADMLLDAERFYAELDGFFAGRDNKATEKYLLDTLDALENSILITTECTCRADADCGTGSRSGPSEEELRWAAERSRGLIMALNELACFYRGLGRLEESIRAFRRALLELELCGLEGSEGCALALVNMAGTLRLLGRYEEALEDFEKARAILDKNGGSDAYAYASLWNNEGLVYQDLRDFGKAAVCFEAALSLLPDTEQNRAERATNLANLALACFNLGRTGEAEARIDASLELFKALDGGTNPHYAGALNTKAFFLFSAGDVARAAEAFEEAARITRLVYGESREYAVACRNCAYALDRLGEAEKAERYRALAERAGA
jgi:tetratricopeptide (TPR) repeat protein